MKTEIENEFMKNINVLHLESLIKHNQKIRNYFDTGEMDEYLKAMCFSMLCENYDKTYNTIEELENQIKNK